MCSDDFGAVDAAVACRQLGFATGRVAPLQHFGPGKGRVWMGEPVSIMLERYSCSRARVLRAWCPWTSLDHASAGNQTLLESLWGVSLHRHEWS